MVVRTMALLAALAMASGFLQGCSTTQTSWNSISRRFSDLDLHAVPTDPVKLHKECAWLHSKAQRIKVFLANSAKNSNPDGWDLMWQSEARRRLVDLASRHDQIQCRSAPSLLAKDTEPNKPARESKITLGGFEETFAEPDVLRVRRTRGRQYTSGVVTRDLALLRAAEIMFDKGLPYFAVAHQQVDERLSTGGALGARGKIGTPIAADKLIAGLPNARYIAGEDSLSYNPALGLLVRGFKERPADVFTFDAELVIRSIRSEYQVPDESQDQEPGDR